MQPTEERWVPIAGTDGFYEVSDQGRIRSWNATVRGERRRRAMARILKPYRVAHDYLQIELPVGKRLMHRLVAEAFIGPQPVDRPEVAHRDGNNQNNAARNLRYSTHAENEADKKLHGTARGRNSAPRAA